MWLLQKIIIDSYCFLCGEEKKIELFIKYLLGIPRYTRTSRWRKSSVRLFYIQYLKYNHYYSRLLQPGTTFIQDSVSHVIPDTLFTCRTLLFPRELVIEDISCMCWVIFLIRHQVSACTPQHWVDCYLTKLLCCQHMFAIFNRCSSYYHCQQTSLYFSLTLQIWISI